jgi:hypothetical protein
VKNAGFTIAIQYEEWGYFATVDIAVDLSGTSSILVEFADAVDEQWRDALKFGIRYAWEHIGNSCSAGLRVKVEYVEWNPVDTTQLVVAYTAAMALWKALEVAPTRLPYVDAKEGTIAFPK